MFSISAEWESTQDGTPEERACFAAVEIRYNNISLTEGNDPFVKRIRLAPMLSAYHLAEWFVWNWWRLRWEPRSQVAEWSFAHRVATVGQGYVWPNITIFSDGERIAVIAKPSRDQDSNGYRYIADAAAVIPGVDFENAIDKYIQQVLGQLSAEEIQETNLNRLWSDLSKERTDSQLRQIRKTEALLGYDPDEAPVSIISELVSVGAILGAASASELAAENSGRDQTILLGDIQRIANDQGYVALTHDAFRLRNWQPDARSQVPAWRYGAHAAQIAREELGLSNRPVENTKLSELLAVDQRVLDRSSSTPFSFSLSDQNANKESIVLRSRWETGRRFELARLLGDKLVDPSNNRLHLATRTYTYRQKMQRSFAAEFLSPFEEVEAMLDGDYSDEQQHYVADHFHVSPLTIRTLLVNHRRIERDNLDDDFEIVQSRAIT